MNTDQASQWYQAQMDKSVARGEDPAKAIERIDAEQAIKIFAKVPEKPKESPLDALRANRMADISTPALDKLHKPITDGQAQARFAEMMRRAIPDAALRPVNRPPQQEILPQPPRPKLDLPPVEPARFQYRVKLLDICNDEGEIETVRVLIE